MSSQPVRTVSSNGGTLVPWQKGQSGNPGGLTKMEREWQRLRDAELLEPMMALAKKVIARAMRDADSDLYTTENHPAPGGSKFAELAVRMCGLFPRATDKSLVEALVRETFEQALAAARARRQGSSTTDPSGQSHEQEPRDPPR